MQMFTETSSDKPGNIAKVCMPKEDKVPILDKFYKAKGRQGDIRIKRPKTHNPPTKSHIYPDVITSISHVTKQQKFGKNKH